MNRPTYALYAQQCKNTACVSQDTASVGVGLIQGAHPAERHGVGALDTLMGYSPVGDHLKMKSVAEPLDHEGMLDARTAVVEVRVRALLGYQPAEDADACEGLPSLEI